MESFSEFILKNENADTAKLILARDSFPGIDISLAANTIEVRKKFRKKVPSWYGCPGLAYPSRLSAEQCSSENTALYKAALAAGYGVSAIADLTGGLGVDAWAFSAAAGKVLYNEMDPVLAETAERNFRELGCPGITVRSVKIVPESLESEPCDCPGSQEKGKSPQTSPEKLLHDFSPDMIFLDPARRDAGGAKVFLLEHCSPDVLQLKDELFRICRFVMLKLSPMADIGMLLKRLGKECRELHILVSGGECKEIIVLMDRDFSGECRIVAASSSRDMKMSEYADIGPVSTERLSDVWSAMQFSLNEISAAAPVLVSSWNDLAEGKLLFEPGKDLMKAGVFNLLCRKYPLKKLGISTHYYISEGCPDGYDILGKHGKFFRILETMPLNNASVKIFGKKYPGCEVTARNIRMDTDNLRRRIGSAGGGSVHVFGLRCDFPSGPAGVLIAASRCD